MKVKIDKELLRAVLVYLDELERKRGRDVKRSKQEYEKLVQTIQRIENILLGE